MPEKSCSNAEVAAGITEKTGAKQTAWGPLSWPLCRFLLEDLSPITYRGDCAIVCLQ